MNKLIGYLKIKRIIMMNIDRNMAIMDTDKSADCMAYNNKVNKLKFFDNYDEFKDIIKNMNDKEKKLFVSMAPECSLENYFLFDHVKPDDMLMHFEKEKGKTKCTFNKKSMKLKREYYEKRRREQN